MGSNGSVLSSSPLGIFLSTTPPITSILTFLSPVRTVYGIYKLQSTQSLPASPYVSMLLQGVVWTGYGIFINSLTVILPNFGSIVLGFLYTVIYHRYAQDVRTLYKLYFAFISVCVVFGVLSAQDNAKELVGYMGMITTIAFYFSPLVMLFHVIKTKSVDSMPLDLTIVAFLNSSLWVLFGWYVQDDYTLWATCSLGVFSASLQLLCHICYGDLFFCFKRKKTERKVSQMVEKPIIVEPELVSNETNSIVLVVVEEQLPVQAV